MPHRQGWEEIKHSVMLHRAHTKFGNFPTIDRCEGQRNFLQADALYSDDYEEYFAGSIIFEYSVELSEVDKENGSSSFPSQENAKDKWGLGYFLPSDYNDIETSCRYMPFPEFDILTSKNSAVDGSVIPLKLIAWMSCNVLQFCRKPPLYQAKLCIHLSSHGLWLVLLRHRAPTAAPMPQFVWTWLWCTVCSLILGAVTGR